MMTIDEIVNRHAIELEGIKDNIHTISVDLQLLVKDHKYVADKMEEIVKKMESFAMYLYCIENHTKLIEKLVKDYEVISNQQREFEQRFRIMDEREKAKSKFVQIIVDHWWKAVTIISSLTLLAYQIGENVKHFVPK